MELKAKRNQSLSQNTLTELKAKRNQRVWSQKKKKDRNRLYSRSSFNIVSLSHRSGYKLGMITDVP